MHADASACKLKAVAWLQTLQNDVLKSVKELDDLMKIYHKEQVPCYPRLPPPPPTLSLSLSRSTRRGTRRWCVRYRIHPHSWCCLRYPPAPVFRVLLLRLGLVCKSRRCVSKGRRKRESLDRQREETDGETHNDREKGIGCAKRVRYYLVGSSFFLARISMTTVSTTSNPRARTTLRLLTHLLTHARTRGLGTTPSLAT